MTTYPQTPRDAYAFRDAFQLFRYTSEDGRIVEFIWNSRDGMAPISVRSKDKKIRLNKGHGGELRPAHIPQVGDRVVVSLSEHHANAIAEGRFEGDVPEQELGDQVDRLYSALHRVRRGDPVIVSVTPELQAHFASRK